MSPKMTEIVFFRNNRKKTNKISQISFFPTHFLVHMKGRCPPKVAAKPTSIHIYIYKYTNIYIYIYVYIYIDMRNTHRFKVYSVE